MEQVLAIYKSRVIPSQLPHYNGQHVGSSNPEQPTHDKLLKMVHDGYMNSQVISRNLSQQVPADESRYNITAPLIEKHRLSDCHESSPQLVKGFLDYFRGLFN
jgi:hypothetical protein